MTECGRFARGPDRDQPMDAFGDLPVNEAGEAGRVDFASLNGVIRAVRDPFRSIGARVVVMPDGSSGWCSNPFIGAR